MTILFGHPSGNPNSYQAALAHLEAGQLEAFCVAWMPSSPTVRALECIGSLWPMAHRLRRRHFLPLAKTRTIQGRRGEFRRLLTRAVGRGNERLSYEANDWLMCTMSRECQRAPVSAVHSYEDCSLWQFVEAKRLGKACIYDLPIGYYPAWQQIQTELTQKYAKWLPEGGLPSNHFVRPEQKRREMELADLVLVPSNFVAGTVAHFTSNKQVALAPYGIDIAAWPQLPERIPKDIITFLFVGQCSLRKGVPLLIEAWRAAELKNARLQLVGLWQLADARKAELPPTVELIQPVSHERILSYYSRADVFVLPTYFEGRALVVGEALASGLPVITTPASGAEDLIDDSCGRLVPTGSFDALVESLRWANKNREQLLELSYAARVRAECSRWESYRQSVTEAITPFV